jgi:NADH-quinone oxidoreductase subunit I
MTNDFELAGPTRAGLIWEKQDLLVGLAPGMLAPPHPMVAGLVDDDYYQGKVSGPTMEQIDWVKKRRPNDPTIAEAEKAARSAQASTGEGGDN